MDRERKRMREQARGGPGQLSEPFEVAEDIADALAQARMHLDRSELAAAEAHFADAWNTHMAHLEMLERTPLYLPLHCALVNVGAQLLKVA